LAQANALALVHCIQNAEVDLFFVLKAETRQKNILGHGNAVKTAPETHSKYLADNVTVADSTVLKSQLKVIKSKLIALQHR